MDYKKTILEIAKIGELNKSLPFIANVEIFKNYFEYDGSLKVQELNETDGSSCTRRELLTRYLFLNAVLDQGPDTEGVRLLLCNTINYLYSKEIRILHKPIEFFNYLGIVIDDIDQIHDIIKRSDRPQVWAQDNNANANRYNLFMDNCQQTLNYAVFRWGVPLSVIMVLMAKNPDSKETLIEYIESDSDPAYPSSAEIMSNKIKSHKKLGLGKAIGDKAAHLFAKWFVHSFSLTTKANQINWGKYSYEPPFDSNAGRVLFRTGFFLHFFNLKDLIKYKFIQTKAGKNGNDFLRITNIRGYAPTMNVRDIDIEIYCNLCIYHLRVKTRNPRKYEIQNIPSTVLMKDGNYSIGNFDDGLMYIGTNYCFNTNSPSCKKCPIKNYCEGFKHNNALISNYNT